MLFNDKPKVIRFELTNRCNLRCKMCGIWSVEPKKNIDLELFEGLLGQRTLLRTKLISLTGGEPFILDELNSYFNLIKKYHHRSHINISTNGYFTEKTVDFLQTVDRNNMSITISYDGLRSHDAIRGVEGSAQRLLNTANQIRRKFPKVSLSLKMTITNENHSEILDTAIQCKRFGIPFRLKILQKLTCHQGQGPSEIDGPDYLPTVLDSVTAQAREVLTLGLETNRDYIRKLILWNKGDTVLRQCPLKTIFIGSDGQVFMCRMKSSVGNIWKHSLDDIWKSEQRIEMSKEMKKCPVPPDCLSFSND